MKKYLTYKDTEGKVRFLDTHPNDPMDFVRQPHLLIEPAKAKDIPMPSSCVLCLIMTK